MTSRHYNSNNGVTFIIIYYTIYSLGHKFKTRLKINRNIPNKLTSNRLLNIIFLNKYKVSNILMSRKVTNQLNKIIE